MQPVDTFYDVLFLEPVALPEPGAGAMLVAGGALLGSLWRRRCGGC
jgi:hypothetical protein